LLSDVLAVLEAAVEDFVSVDFSELSLAIGASALAGLVERLA